MKGDPKVIDYLNKALRHELTAVSQYWLHYRLQDDWGLGHMAKKSREESIEQLMSDEEGHIDFLETQLELYDRIGSKNYEQLNAYTIDEGDD